MDARIGVCGDSAGGTLAAVACQDLVGASGVAPRLQVLLCPIMDYAGRSPSRLEFATGHFLDESTLDHDLRYYLPAGTDPADPRVSPLRAVGPLPRIPTIIHTAEFDPLRDEGARYAERLTGAGATVAYTCHAGMIHLFYGLGVIPRARVALAGIGAELGAALRAAGPERALAPAP
jgi:acetyl esterase/lipase